MTEYVCLTVLAEPEEAEAGFKARLLHSGRTCSATSWTSTSVCAEATRFGRAEGRVSRQYMVEAAVAAAVTAELVAKGLTFAPVDVDDTYTKYEAASPDWFQIEH